MRKGRIRFNSNEPPLAILQRCGGYYECPTDPDGKHLGPMVGYAGEYAPGMHWVGYVYANFAKAEAQPSVLQHYCVGLRELMLYSPLEEVDVFCGAPLGGMATAYQLALLFDCQYGFAEKKVLKAAADGQREESKLVFGRHEVDAGDNVIIVEDVCNNFSTTEELLRLIKKAGGNVLAIVTLLNRSATVADVYYSPCGGTIPVVSMVTKPIPQYRQDDPRVSATIAAGNVVWKPKAEWDRLMTAMNAVK